MDKDVIRSLGYKTLDSRFKRISDRMSHDIRKLYKEYNIDVEPNWHLLFMYLMEHKKSSIAEIAQGLGYAHPSVVIIVQKMTNKGYLTSYNIKQMTALCLRKYINEKSYIKINGKVIDLKLNDSYTEKDHLVINLSTEVTSDPVKELIISNRCFYEFNPKFKNRVILDIAQFQKSYMLTRTKDVIHLK